MIRAIKQFFENNIMPPAESSGQASEHCLQLATAALLVEMMRADTKISVKEQKAIADGVRSKFGLSQEEADTLIKLAEEETKNATDYYEFTALINKGFTYEQKIKVVEHLWEIAYADDRLDKHEEHLVRRIADLIYVSHNDFIEAKLKVRGRQ